MEIIGLFILIIGLYRQTWDFGLVMDDLQWFASKADGFGKHKSIWRLIQDRLYGGTTFGTNPKIEHRVTTVMHMAICALMYYVLGHDEIARWATVLYACNAINNQTSIWLNGRRYAVNIILLLTMMLLPNPWGLLLYPLTLKFQVTAIFAPVLLGSWKVFLLALVILPFCWKEIYAKCRARIKTMAKGEMMEIRPRRLIMVVKTFGFYFFKMLIPGICAMQYPDFFYWGKTKEGNKEAYCIDGRFFQGILAMAIVAGMYMVIPENTRPWLIFMVLAILQWCSIIPIVQTLADRYVSLPNVFMMYFLALGLHALPWYWGHLAVTAIAFYYAACTWSLMPMYKDITSYYLYHIERFPHIPWPRAILIGTLLEEGKLDAAQAQVHEGLVHNPKDYGILLYGATMALFRGGLDTALVFLDEAEKNMYIGQEETQRQEISHLREQIQKTIKYLRPS